MLSDNNDGKQQQIMMEEKLCEFRDWIKTQKNLPQNIDRLLLLRYLKTYNFRVEKAQKLLVYSLEMRTKNKQIFTDRDFLSPEIQKVYSTCDMVPLMKATSQNYKSCIFRLCDYNSNDFIFNDVIKAFFMVADVRMVTPDPDPENLADGELPIFDMKGVTIWHLFKISLSTLRLYFKYTQEAHPIRAKQIHVYNCTSLLNRIMSLIKPLLKPEVAARFHFHEPDSDTLFEFVPRDMLPEEYGGTAGPISEMRKHWTEIFMKNRNYIMNDSNWMLLDEKDDLNNNDC